jgi:hypothetical protein
MLPSDMIPFGASDAFLQDQEMVTFAYIEDVRGGLTQKFSIPYPVCVINATVTAQPENIQYTDFRMVLSYVSNGTVINGMEILHQGSEIRVVRAPNVDLYMIISTAYVDHYRIELMTPKQYLSDLFYGYFYPVACFQFVPFGDIDVKPECPGIVLIRVLRHQTVFELIDVGNEFYL